MQIIDTTVLAEMTVEIDGKEFAVAPKTVETASKLMSVYRTHKDSPEYKVWLAELEILLGKDAVAELFTGGKQENIDRIHLIRSGVMRAFEYNAEQTAASEMEERVGMINNAARALTSICDRLGAIANIEAKAADSNSAGVRRG